MALLVFVPKRYERNFKLNLYSYKEIANKYTTILIYVFWQLLIKFKFSGF